MKKKEFAVLGLGDFGMSVAKTLAQNGYQVLAVDDNEDHVQEISDYVTQVVKGDVEDVDMLKSLGLGEMDAVVIGIGNNLEASIMATIVAKEEGVPFILAKVNNEIHETVLKKLGVNHVLYVEKAMGEKVARNLIYGRLLEFIELSDQFSMAEVRVPEDWIGKTLRQLNLRGRFGLNVVALKYPSGIEPVPNPDRTLQKTDALIVIGDNRQLEKII